ncbi:hypothetical protein QFC22_003361 [Naganishia vaughanmartiniae]|uniref:Uncharacterized protein n=1 Tax=Naganishia vaughanmartiniae TaxID=1424756 RepID=A0ACC2X9A5_9TREE|nr:hypothetical protein QFC22_003361 [Naganishia vaughanmartiniae]
MPSLAVAASLVLKSPQFVAKLFLNHDGKQNGKLWPIPANAILLPDIEGESCRDSGITTAGNLRDSSDKHFDILVDFPGGSDYYAPPYTGDELKAADTSDNSAWVFLFQATMLHYAQNDVQSSPSADEGGQWKNTRDGGQNKQMFNPEFVPQEGENLDRMLFLATNKETSQTAIEAIQDEELKAVLDSMSKSPVLVIPKADTHNILASDRIWIGIGPAEEQGTWTFYNPVERKTRTASRAQLREGVVQDIIYITDHSSLADST